jgi:acyl-CoA synthetase (AMP-forming)/AMP-acid ligase II
MNDPVAIRNRLRADPGIGMGNFLWKTIEARSNEVRPIVSARPLETAWGERYDSFSLSDLARLAEQYARHYAGLGVRAYDPVGIYVDHGTKYLLHFLALTRLGAIPVLVNQHMNPATAERHMRRVGVVGVFADEPRRAALRDASDAEFGFMIVESDFRSTTVGSFKACVHDENDPVLITHSSGTTGFPKAVLLQHGCFFYPIARELDGPPDSSTLRVLSALPSSHNSAISAAAISIVTGRELILMSDLDGASVLQAIEYYRPTSVVAFPQTFVDILASSPETSDLSSVAMWFNLGDAAHESHIRKLMRFGNHRRGRFSFSGSQFIDGLGSSEMGVTLFSTVHSPATRRFGRCVGRPRPWVDAAILDADGTKLADGNPGFLGIKSPSVSTAYWNDSMLTYKSRRSGYFLTGDIAVRDRLGRFHHLDRVTDTVMAQHGPIYTLLYEEAIMNATDDILDCSVVALETQPSVAHLICFAILRKDAQQEHARLRDKVDSALTSHGLQPLTELRLIARADLAVGVTGKVLKARIRQSLRQELIMRSGPTTASADGTASSSRPERNLQAMAEAAQ